MVRNGPWDVRGGYWVAIISFWDGKSFFLDIPWDSWATESWLNGLFGVFGTSLSTASELVYGVQGPGYTAIWGRSIFWRHLGHGNRSKSRAALRVGSMGVYVGEPPSGGCLISS